MTKTARFPRDWAVVPGPSAWPGPGPLYSTDLHELVERPAPEVMAALLAIPGVTAMRPPPQSAEEFWRWRALYEDADDLFEIAFSLFEIDDAPLIWGGSVLSGCSAPLALHRFFSRLHALLNGVWLHDPDCEMLSPDAFAARFLTA